MITSRSNQRIKDLAKLSQKKWRSDVTIAEGIHLVNEALSSGIEVKCLVVSERGAAHAEAGSIIAAAQQQGVEVLSISEGCYRKISCLRSPEGIAAVIAIPKILPVFDRKAKLLVAAGIQDPGNAGALCRTAEAAGVSGCVFLSGVDLSSPAFLRATMGSIFRLPCATMAEQEFLSQAEENDIRILATTCEPAGTLNPDFTPPAAICIGAEGTGLPSSLIAPAHQKLHIPMRQPVESLNAAVAAGILLYQAGWVNL